MHSRPSRATFQLVILSVVALCGAVFPSEGRAQPANCTTTSQNLYVSDVLNDIYFWNQQLPRVNAAGFSSPEALLEAVRYKTLDSSFSYIASRQEDEAFFSESQFIGFGLSTQVINGVIWVAQIFPDSPASEAGLMRGHRLVEIGGRSAANLIESGDVGSIFGPSEVGYQLDIVFRSAEGRDTRARMTKRLVTIPTVSATRVFDVGGRTVGYMFFRNFVEPSFGALEQAFNELSAAGARELVLDLRYNGGGLVSVAQHLAGLIGGARTSGQIFAEYFHNDRNAFRNRITRFESPSPSLNLDRLIVIATRGSASASELVINALRPFVPVTVIGDRTFGKPVGQYGFPFCDRVLHPVSFTLRNANGQGDFFDGFPADCSAADDLQHQLGDAQEGSLAEALHFVQTGSCSASASSAAAAHLRRVSGFQPTGWQQLLGAF
jgi:carboxyl-terminal processing protease